MLSVHTVPVQEVVLDTSEAGGVDILPGDHVELGTVPVEVKTSEDVVTEEKGSPELVVELAELGLVALPTRLELTELALASLSLDRDERTLRTELVAMNDPVVIFGVVPARLIVGEVVRPRAALSAVLTAVDVLIAGVTEDSELVVVGTPDGA